MSLISPKNLVAPFQNKVAIGAIVVLTVIVAVARIAGSHSSRQSSDTPRTDALSDPQSEALDNEIRDFLSAQSDGSAPRAALDPKRVPQRRNGAAPIDDDVLSGLLAEELAPNNQRDTKSPDTQAGGLHDIKKSLGLE
jgi:hypothetical protein